MTALEAHFTGLENYRDVVSRLDDRVKQAVLKSAQKAAAQVVMQAIRDRTPRETGLLKSAVGSKTRVNAEGTGVYTMIGINRKTVAMVAAQTRVQLPKGRLAVVGAVSRLKSGETAQGMRRRRPSKYYANVEKGHGGPHPAGACPYIEPAFEAARQAVNQIMYAYVRQVVSGSGGGSAVAGDSDDSSAFSGSFVASQTRKLKSAIARTRRRGVSRPMTLASRLSS